MQDNAEQVRLASEFLDQLTAADPEIVGREVLVELIWVLARLDFGGSPHRNPDGKEVNCPYLHLYREGFHDKWAFPVPTGSFSDIGDPWRTLEDFMRFCNITAPPDIRQGLFT